LAVTVLVELAESILFGWLLRKKAGLSKGVALGLVEPAVAVEIELFYHFRGGARWWGVVVALGESCSRQGEYRQEAQGEGFRHHSSPFLIPLL
jgi:hypothetical protein